MKRFVIACLALLTLTHCRRVSDSSLMERARELETREKYTEAAALFEKVAHDYPESGLAPEALYLAGMIYSGRLEEHRRAVTLLERAINRYPSDPGSARCRFMTGFILSNSLSDTLRARQAYQAFLDDYPDHDLAPSVHWELKYLGKDIDEIPELRHLESPDSKDN